jgi:S1-C subfamily serine protease
MYEITPPNRSRNRSALFVILAVSVVLLGSCFLITVGGFVLFGFNGVSQGVVRAGSAAANQSVSAVSVAAQQQPTPRAQTIVQPPPEGIDYESAVLRNIYEQVNPSVVNITVNFEHPALTGSDEDLPEGFEITSSGSGFVWDTAGHIVTNYHVVETVDSVQVTFSDGTMSVAEVIGRDEDSDLAVVQIDPTGYDLVPVRLGNMEDIFVGMRVAAIGNPFGLQGTLTSGIVSALGRSIPAPTTRGNFSIPDSVQTDAAINPGNSGGPLLNERGEVIGVNAQIRSEVRSNSGVGFAVPVSIVSRVVPSLIESGSYTHSYLGVSGSTFSPICADELGLEPVLRGVLVGEALAGGPAERAGLRGATERVDTEYPTICPSVAGGDLIIAINGELVTSFDDMLIYLARYTSPGDTVQITLLRDGEEEQVDLTLAARPR